MWQMASHLAARCMTKPHTPLRAMKTMRSMKNLADSSELKQLSCTAHAASSEMMRSWTSSWCSDALLVAILWQHHPEPCTKCSHNSPSKCDYTHTLSLKWALTYMSTSLAVCPLTMRLHTLDFAAEVSIVEAGGLIQTNEQQVSGNEPDCENRCASTASTISLLFC